MPEIFHMPKKHSDLIFRLVFGEEVAAWLQQQVRNVQPRRRQISCKLHPLQQSVKSRKQFRQEQDAMHMVM